MTLTMQDLKEPATTKQNEALTRVSTFIHLATNLTKMEMRVLNQFIFATEHGIKQEIRINQGDWAKYLNTNISTINRAIKRLTNLNIVIKEDNKYSIFCALITGVKKRSKS